MNSNRIPLFWLAINILCLLTMTACSTAENAAPGDGTDLDSAKLTSETPPVTALAVLVL